MKREFDQGSEQRTVRALDGTGATARRRRGRAMPALRMARTAALLLTGVAAGFMAAMALDPDPALGGAPSQISDSHREPYSNQPMETESDWSARAGTYIDARAAAGRAVGSVNFMGTDGRRWRCFEAMIP